MRIGSIAQHSNIGPLSPNILGDRNSIIPNHVPGRLNDPSLGLWVEDSLKSVGDILKSMPEVPIEEE